MIKIIKQGKTAQEIFEELQAQGVEVVIINGVYCKVVDNTYEAINPIPPVVEYEDGELDNDSENK